MRDIISKLQELNVEKQPVEEVLSSKGKDNLIRAVQNFETMAEELNLSDESMDNIAMHLDQMLADVMEIEGVRESKQPVKEGHMSDMAQEVEKDHEVQMARNDLYKSAKYAVAIHKMMKDVSEMEGIDGWVASKITKAADYLGSVKHYMEGQMMKDVELAVVPVAGDMTDAMTVPEEEEAVEEVHESIEEAHEYKPNPGKYSFYTTPEAKLSVQDFVAMVKKANADGYGSEVIYDAVYGRYGEDVENYVVKLQNDISSDEGLHPKDDYEQIEQEAFERIIGEEANTIEEDPIADIIKNLPKNKATKSTTSSDTGIMNQILDKLDFNKGIDGPAKTQTGPSTMPDKDIAKPKTPPVPMQRKQAIANKIARDPYGADTTKSFGRLNDWSKK